MLSVLSFKGDCGFVLCFFFILLAIHQVLVINLHNQKNHLLPFVIFTVSLLSKTNGDAFLIKHLAVPSSCIYLFKKQSQLA